MISLFKIARDEGGIRAAYSDKLEVITCLANQVSRELSELIALAEELKGQSKGKKQSDSLTRLQNRIDFLRYQTRNFSILQNPDYYDTVNAKTSFDPRVLIEDIVHIFEDRAEKKGIELSCLKSANIPKQLIGDPAKLRLIIYNLMQNAIEFTATGDIVLSVSLAEKTLASSSRVMMSFSISDTGHGIEGENPKELFEPFVKGYHGQNRHTPGLGLGLSISEKLIRLLGSELELKSNSSGGTSADFDMSFELVAEKEVPGKRVSEFPAPKMPVNVLVVGELKVNRKTIAETLSKWGFTVISAEEIDDAIKNLENDKHWSEQQIDICVVDVSLAFSSSKAFTIIEKLRLLESCKETRFALLTSEGQPGDFVRAQESGADCYLTKPIDREEFKNCLLELLHQKPGGGATLTKHNIRERNQDKTVDCLIVTEDISFREHLGKALYKEGITTESSAELPSLEKSRFSCFLVDSEIYNKNPGMLLEKSLEGRIFLLTDQMNETERQQSEEKFPVSYVHKDIKHALEALRTGLRLRSAVDNP